MNRNPSLFAATGKPLRPANKPHRLKSAELLSGTREVIIEHEGDEYRLRLTNQGKLILTK
ncbi:MAG: hemin uptake protein HemP [Methylotenera sp.]|nr:hemin uptake protein HemP [Methylotenera sp.]